MKKPSPRTRRILIGAAIALFLYTLIGFLILPLVVKSVLTKKLTALLDRKTTIESVKVNPYNLKCTVRGFSILKKASSETALSFDELFLNLQASSIFRGGVIVKEFRLVGPYLGIVRNNDMTYNFSDLIPVADGEKVDAPAEEGDGFKFSINNIQIIDGNADIVDHPKGVDHQLRDLMTTIPFVSNLPSRVDIFVEPSFSALFNGTLFEFAGTTKPFKDSLETTLEINFDRLSLPYYMAYVPVETAFTLPAGTFSADLTLSYTQYQERGPSLSLKGNVTLREVELVDLREEPLLLLPLLTVDIASAELFTGEIALTKVFLQRPELFALLDKEGGVNLARLVPPTEGADVAVEVEEEGGEPPFSLAIDSVEVEDGALHFTDLTPSTPFVRHFTPLDITVSRFSTEGEKEGELSLLFKNSAGETISTEGAFSVNPVTADLNLEVSDISIPAHQPYIDEVMKVDVRQGGVSTSGRLTLASSGAINYRGKARVKDLSAMERDGAEDLFKLKELSVDGIDLGLKPTYMNITEVTATGIFARAELSPQGVLNLTEIVPAKEEDAQEVESEPAGEERTPISVGSVVIEKGRLHFSDKQVVPHYSADLDIDGKVTGLSSEEEHRADLSFEAKIDKYAPLNITGTISPLSGDLFMDIAVDFKDFELSSVSPYSGKYIGKAIDRGKLILDLTYLIEKRNLDSENKVVLDQIDLGKRIKSKDATGLPVGLALALLKDRQGKINLDLPVSGSLDDPEFSVAGIVVKMVVNLFVKAATSPFALLGALFGGGEEISFVDFEPGSYALTAESMAKLDNLVNALYERPNLNLDIEGHVDSVADAESLRHQRFERAVKEEKFRRAAKREKLASVDDVVIKPEKYEKYLWRAYKRADFPKEKTKLRLTKKIPAEDMKRLMLEHIVISDNDLRNLAGERSKAVKDYMLSTEKIEPERVFIVWSDLVKEGEKLSRVEFKLK